MLTAKERIKKKEYWCQRCSVKTSKIERHHKRYRSVGGPDKRSNLLIFCHSCHKYIHARHSLLVRLRQSSLGNGQRALDEYRLKVLAQFNRVEEVRTRQTYKSYWEDPRTHSIADYLRGVPLDKLQMLPRGCNLKKDTKTSPASSQQGKLL